MSHRDNKAWGRSYLNEFCCFCVLQAACCYRRGAVLFRSGRDVIVICADLEDGIARRWKVTNSMGSSREELEAG